MALQCDSVLYDISFSQPLRKGYQILEDVSSSGKSISWQEKKLNSLLIAESFARIGKDVKADRIKNCGTYLVFKRFLSDGHLKLGGANFCKARLCPLCSWRRSLKIFGQVNKIMNELTKNKDYEFIFLTLTVKNCKGLELSSTISAMMQAYNSLFKKTKIKKSILGAFRALEVTHNTKEHSKSFNTYHPHFHCILLVNKSYFHSKNFIRQYEWVNLWREAMKLDYKPLVDVCSIQDNYDGKGIVGAVAETAKYTVKATDLLNINQDLQDEAVKYIDKSLENRRLISFKGEFARVRKLLKLDEDLEKCDLINTDNEEDIREDLDYVIERYFWHVGYYQYLRLDDNKYLVPGDDSVFKKKDKR